MGDGAKTSAGGGSILLVDDDPSIARLLELVFTDAGFRTALAPSAEAALTAIEGGGIVGVVLDNHLPGMSGVDLLRVLRSHPASVTLPVLLLTGDDQLAARVGGLEAGATDYVVKPFEPAELVARFEAHLRAAAAWEARLAARPSAVDTETERRRADLFAVVADRAFFPVFQPLVVLAGGGVVGYEALTRFTDSVPPDRRFAEAAALGLGADLELATVEAAIHAARELRGERFLSLNVSADLIVNHSGALQRVLAGRDREVVLELTEHEAVEDYESLRAALTTFDPPVELSVDDAGAGFASLRHVVMLEPAYVKLDRSWVTDIDADPTRQAMVAGLSHFARQTGSKLVAEGIETEPERATLERLEVDLGQGYLLGAPART
ncbi:MAG TPA: EAL domain-containing protein [Acidimicrobiales bacterium]